MIIYGTCSFSAFCCCCSLKGAEILEFDFHEHITRYPNVLRTKASVIWTIIQLSKEYLAGEMSNKCQRVAPFSKKPYSLPQRAA